MYTLVGVFILYFEVSVWAMWNGFVYSKDDLVLLHCFSYTVTEVSITISLKVCQEEFSTASTCCSYCKNQLYDFVIYFCMGQPNDPDVTNCLDRATRKNDERLCTFSGCNSKQSSSEMILLSVMIDECNPQMK